MAVLRIRDHRDRAWTAATAVFAQSSDSCEKLKSLMLPNTVDHSMAQSDRRRRVSIRIPGRGAAYQDTFQPSAAPAATPSPTSDSDIKIELWLPLSGWNGKFQAQGNGGWAGIAELRIDGARRRNRLREREHRHWPRWRQRQLRAGPS